MNCPNCGNDVAASQSVCPKCGKPLTSPVAAPRHLGFKTNGAPTLDLSGKKAPQPVQPEPALQPLEENELPAEMPSPSAAKNKKIWGIIMLVFGLFLIGGGTWALAGKPRLVNIDFCKLWNKLPFVSSQSLADLVPRDSDVFVRVRIDEDDDQVKKVKDLWAQFPAHSQWDDALQQWFDSDSEDTSFSWENDIEPWLDDEVGFFITLASEENPTSEQGFIIATKDTEIAKQGIDKLIQSQGAKATTSVYQDISITKIEIKSQAVEVLADQNSLQDTQDGENSTTANGYLAFLKNYFVACSSEARLQKVIDAYKGGANFTETTDFSTIQAQLSDDSLATVYIDRGYLGFPNISDIVDQTYISLFANNSVDLHTMFAPLIGWLQTDGTQSEGNFYGLFALQIIAENAGLHVDTYIGIDKDKLATTGYKLGSDNFKPSLMNDIPATVAYLEAGKNIAADLNRAIGNASLSQPDVKTTYDSWLTLLASEPYMLDWEQDVLTWMTGEYAFAVIPHQDLPVLSFVLAVDDPLLAEARLEKISQAAHDYFAQQTTDTVPDSLFSEQEINGNTIKVLQYPDLSSYLTLAYAFVGDNLIVSTSADGITPFIEVNQGSQTSLIGDAYFLAAYGQMPDAANNFVFISRPYVTETISGMYQIFPGLEENALDIAGLDESFQPFRSVALSTTLASDYLSTNWFFYIKQ